MQIRTIILIITFIGSILAALVAALITNQREVLQAQADAEARWGIYKSSIDRYISDESQKLTDFGLNGTNGYFWLPENAQPLQEARLSTGLYTRDISAVLWGNPQPTNTVFSEAEDYADARRMLRIFRTEFAERELLFFKNSEAFRTNHMSKTFFPRI